ncbi:MAG: hypothetical protein V1838_02665 [Patescibacteria group bacterium]
MNKYILYIIIIIIVVGAILAGGWYFFIKNGEEVVSNTNTTTDQVVNTNSIDTTKLVVETEEGDTEVNASLTYKEVKFTFSSSTKAASWHSKEAAAGKHYLVVYFNPIAAEVKDVIAWMKTDAVLVNAAGDKYSISEMKVVGTGGSETDTGYLAFIVDAEDSGFSVGFGDSTTALGF